MRRVTIACDAPHLSLEVRPVRSDRYEEPATRRSDDVFSAQSELSEAAREDVRTRSSKSSGNRALNAASHAKITFDRRFDLKNGLSLDPRHW